MNVQAETNEDKDKGLVYNHDNARVLATIITTFNKCMECTVEEQGQQYIVTYSLKAGINKFGKQAMVSAHKVMNSYMIDPVSGQFTNAHSTSQTDKE